jgi:hypothetical protein
VTLKKLDKYLRHIMAHFNAEALKFPFGGLHIVFCGDFCQLNPIGTIDIQQRSQCSLEFD